MMLLNSPNSFEDFTRLYFSILNATSNRFLQCRTNVYSLSYPCFCELNNVAELLISMRRPVRIKDEPKF